MIANGQNELVGKSQLTPEELTQIELLADICNEQDGIELKLNWDLLRSRLPFETNDFLYEWQGQLIGYLGLFAPNPREIEVTGMVHPNFRRQSIFRHLYEKAAVELRERGISNLIFSVDHVAASGQAFARSLGARYSLTEYRMVLGKAVPLQKQHEGLTVDFAVAEDQDFYAACMERCFGLPEAESRRVFIEALMSLNRQLYTVRLDGEPIGSFGAVIGGAAVTLHQLAIMPEYRGHGYGKQVFAETVHKMLAGGYPNIEFQLRCHREQSRGMYESCGFEVAAAFDYFEVTLPVAGVQGELA